MAGYTYDTPPFASGAPPRLTVATGQFPVSSSIARNLAHIARLTARARSHGADVAHFPEGALSGHGPTPWPDWDAYDWAESNAALDQVRGLARQHGIWLVLGGNRRDDTGRCFNSVSVIDARGGMVAQYDKRCCSANDLRAFAAGAQPVAFTLNGVRCGVLICLEWSFPELWQAHAADGAELMFLSANAAGQERDRNHTHTIPALMQGYGFLHSFAISVSNASQPRQEFPSLWIERSGHLGRRCRRSTVDLAINALPDDPAQDGFYDMVRKFRRETREDLARRAAEQPSPPR